LLGEKPERGISKLSVFWSHKFPVKIWICHLHIEGYGRQGCGSGSELDPDSIGSVDPDPYSESRRVKMTHKT
jgi:hypothetical protein